MLFKIRSSRVSFKEYFYDASFISWLPILIIGGLSKLLRVDAPCSIDFPPVNRLSEFLVDRDALPDDLRRTLEPLMNELSTSGFAEVTGFSIRDIPNNVQYGGIILINRERSIIAVVHDRRWPPLPKVHRYARVTLYSFGENEQVIYSTSSLRDLNLPSEWQATFRSKASTPDLLRSHNEAINQSTIKALRLRRFATNQDALEALDKVQQEFADFQLARGVFVPPPESPTHSTMPPEPQPFMDEDGLVRPVLVEPVDSALDQLVAEVRKQEAKQTHWFVKFVWLALSIFAFIGLGALAWDWKLVMYMIPILFVHEMGHLIAMKLFGYRNVQMLFIPLVGAIVSGRQYHIAGWKKAVVALAGPVPSIAIACVGLTVGWWFDIEWLWMPMILTLVINVLNLLPFLPMDGGWVAHATLFSRTPVLEIVFRGTAIFGLLGMAFLFSSIVLAVIGGLMLFSMPTEIKILKAKEKLKRHPIPEPQNGQIPTEAIQLISLTAQDAGIPTAGIRQVAQLTITIYEGLLVRPPGVAASLGILGIHLTAFVVPIVLGLTIAVAHHLARNDLFEGPGRLKSEILTFNVKQDDIDSQLSEPSNTPLPDSWIWQFEDDASARQEFLHQSGRERNSLVRFGDLILESAPRGDSSVPLGEGPWANKLKDFVDRAKNDPRLLEVSESVVWARRVDDCPVLLVTFSDKAAAKYVEKCFERFPYHSTELLFVPPWSQAQPPSETAGNLRKLLAQLNRDDEPWLIDGLTLEDDSEEAIQAEINTHFEKWLSEKYENATPQERALVDAYRAAVSRADQMIVTDVSQHLSDTLKSSLELIDLNSPERQIGCRNAFFSLADTPHSMDAPIACRVTIQECHDSAAALVAVINWLDSLGGFDFKFEQVSIDLR